MLKASRSSRRRSSDPLSGRWPHANRRIQVSYPVSEWIQVVGYCREVTLERDEGTVTVAVKGPVLAKNTSEAPLTIIRASLIERRVNEYGVAYERPARTLIDGNLGEPTEQVSYANAPSDELIWQVLSTFQTRTTATIR
jgi:hypothetical protein